MADTSYVSEISNDPPSMTLSPRLFAGIIGGILALVGVIAVMFVPVTTSYQTALGFTANDTCGTTLNADVDRFSGQVRAECEDAVGTRRAWGWPLTAAGVLVIAGAALVRSAPKDATAAEPSDPTGSD